MVHIVHYENILVTLKKSFPNFAPQRISVYQNKINVSAFEAPCILTGFLTTPKIVPKNTIIYAHKKIDCSGRQISTENSVINSVIR